MASLNGFAEKNLLENPSFELIKPKDTIGIPFEKWTGWKYEGGAQFEVGQVAHKGAHSALLLGNSSPKIRIWQERELKPGRYRVSAFIRGLDIGTGVWNQTTEFMFNNEYMQLDKNGTFGWTPLTYVAELKEPKKVAVSFGLMAPGFFWIDDVTLEEVGVDVPLTKAPILGKEEASIVPSGVLGGDAIFCANCGYKNLLSSKTCYACGNPLEKKHTQNLKPAIQIITDLQDKNPFYGGEIVFDPIFQGKRALRIDRAYTSLDGAQDWSGFDYFKMELYSNAKEPLQFDIEIRDSETRDYWTRVNFVTMAPPGKSTLILPLKQLYVGEKSRPGRKVNLNAITKLLINIGDNPNGALFISKVWLERDEVAEKVKFDGLFAFDFGTGNSPLMDGFTPISPSNLYSPGRGYGLSNAKDVKAYDVLQPDLLYQDYICMESAGFALDLPNGNYHVFLNIDNPSGYWGDYQLYRNRTIFAQGKPVVTETMDFNALKEKYFRFWNVEDLPRDNTFDKYQKAYFKEKSFDVEIINGQLNLDFKGDWCANSVSTIIVYPLSKKGEGEKFLHWVEAKRRFYFDNYFKRALHNVAGDALTPSMSEQKQGFVVFHRDFMKEVYSNDTPFKYEINQPLMAESFAGIIESLTLSLLPLRDLQEVTIEVSDLKGEFQTIPKSAIEIGHVSNRISRVTAEGSIYTIEPRVIMPGNSISLLKNNAQRFWFTIKIPKDVQADLYKGEVTLATKEGHNVSLPVKLRVRKGILDSVDIPVGPFGYTMNVPWFDNDKEALDFNQSLALKSLHTMREFGFTMFSGIPTVYYQGFKDGQPVIDFTKADLEMQLAKDLGFLAVNSYGAGLIGLDPYYQDLNQMKNAGFSNYTAFISAIYEKIESHAKEKQWLPVYWNLADEPLGDDVVRSMENAAAYKAAFPSGPPYFSLASSFKGSDQNDPHFKLAKATHVANLNVHDEAGIRLLHENRADWAFYNGGNRWTYGEYLYKASKEFGMKFRLAWHWNISAGNPYYALDSREDDYAWFHATPNGQLMPEVSFMRIAAGLVDYRMLITLKRLALEKKGSKEAIAAEKLIVERMSKFKLGQREHDAIYPVEDWSQFRQKMADAIESLR